MNRKHSSATKLDGRFAKVILAGLFAWAALFLFVYLAFVTVRLQS